MKKPHTSDLTLVKTRFGKNPHWIARHSLYDFKGESSTADGAIQSWWRKFNKQLTRTTIVPPRFPTDDSLKLTA